MVALCCEKTAVSSRVRYKIPNYKKVYSVYQYDRLKYTEIWQKIRKLAIKYNNPNIFFNVSPYAVLNHCYLKNKQGIRNHTGDAHHIFRTTTLAKIFEAVANEIFQGQQKLYWGEWKLIKDGLVIYFDEYGYQAEIQGTERMPVDKRLKIHIELLRQLRNGVKAKKAIQKILKQYIKC